jgi:small-conductance mechanosensitive channel
MLTSASLLDLAVQLVITAGAILLTGLLLSRVIITAAKKAGVPHTQLHFFRDAMRALFILLAIVAVIHVSGLTSQFTALTLSGIVAIALSLALQTTLTNVISGILLLLDGSIRVGDSVEFSAIKGVVVRIGLRNTWIKNNDGTVVIVSNSQLAGGPLKNYTGSQRLLEKL